MRFAIFPIYLSKVLRLPRKSEARSYEVLHLSRKIIVPKLKIWCSKTQPVSENQRPSQHLWRTCLLYCACHAKCIFADPLWLSHACHRFRKCYKTLTFCSLLTRCTLPCACHAKRHLNVQKCSEPGVFCAFWLRNVLRATTACTFSTSQLPKVVREWCALYILTSKCASRHNGACNFSSLIWPAGSAPAALASLLFDPPEPQIIEKKHVFRDFPTFSHTWIFFLLRLSLFGSSFFFSSLLWLFPSLLFICPYCRKFDF